MGRTYLFLDDYYQIGKFGRQRRRCLKDLQHTVFDGTCLPLAEIIPTELVCE
jgi:hypothetical protein